MVSIGCPKVKSSTLLYVRCTQLVMALPPVFTLPGLMMSTSRKGMTVTARKSDTMRLMVMVHGKACMASRNSPLMVSNNGKKMTQMQSVANIIGMKYCLADSIAACFGSCPLPRYSRYPSMTTMALSTTIPNTTMSAARVTVFSSIPAMHMIPTEMNVESGMVMAATMAERKGKSTIITNIMMTIEMMRSRRKSLTLELTTLGWSAMRVMFTSSGKIFSRKSSSTSSTSSPYFTILLPGVISSESSTQGCPSCSMNPPDVSYSRTTCATSHTRTTLPDTGSLKMIWLAISSSPRCVGSIWMGICWSSLLMLPLIVVKPCCCSWVSNICWPMP